MATLPVALMDGLHGALRTWTRCVDTFIVPSDFTRTKYVEAGWPPDKFAVKYNTALDPGRPDAELRQGFVYVGRVLASPPRPRGATPHDG
jgi:hypothetical protein